MISFNRYVRIVSGVGGGVGVRQRDLIGRIFSNSPLVSPDAVMEFTGNIAANVAAIFGTTSEEYKRAVQYAGYVSPSIATPKKLSIARYAPAGSIAAVYSNTAAKDLNKLKLIIAGVLSVLVNGTPINLTAINFSGAASLAAVATLLQTKIQTGAAPLTTSTVTYDAPTGRFIINIDPSFVGAVSIAQSGAGVTDVGSAMGLYSSDGALNVSGAAAQTPVVAIQRSEDVSDNFGSLLFIPTLTDSEVASVGAYVESLNVKYIYTAPVLAAGAVSLAAALASFGGSALTLITGAGDYAEMIPMSILAATDYSKKNGAQSYMYKQVSGVPVSVTTDANANLYDGMRVNYYGRTQTAGQKIDFYQRGTLMGNGADPLDMNVYANEIWLKDYAASQLMSLQLSVGRLPANKTGAASVRAVIQPVINDALRNGVISVGKTLSSVQKVYIEDVTGEPLAWHAVQNIGYVLSVRIESYVTTGGATEYKAVYVLVYSKDDAIRLIEGTHTLI